MMKKILITSHAMEIGGAERSLLGLLYAIDYAQYSVDLFLYRHAGEFMEMIPDSVNLLPQNERYASLAVPMFNLVKKGQVLMVGGRILGKIMAFCYDKKHKSQESAVGLEYSHKYTKRFLPPINSDFTYDLAISFLTPHYIVAEKASAKKSAAWIHSDYNTLSVNAPSENNMWRNYDYIVSVSEHSARSFSSKFPDLKEKVIIIENIIQPQFVRQQAEKFSVDQEITASNNTYKLLSVGRFISAKNFDNIPAICKNVLASGYKVKWYLIGYGGGETLIRSKIKAYGMQEHVIILGKKVNPYPYFRACDIYVQPSRYEGKAVTVREAQMLRKPVVITDFPTAQSQLKDGFDGLIVPLDNNGCAEGIVRLLKDPKMQNMLIENCRNRDYGNESEVEKVYKLIEH